MGARWDVKTPTRDRASWALGWGTTGLAGVAPGGGELWSPSQPEMGTVGKVGHKAVAKTGITDKRGA